MNRKRVYGGSAPKRVNKKAKSLPAKVSRLQRQVALLRPEEKVFQGSLSVNNITQAAGSIQYVSLVLQGSGDSNRIGDTIRPTYIRVVGLVNPFGSVTQMRMFLVKDMQSNGLVPTIAGANAILTSFVPRIALPNVANRKRFKIIWEYSMTDNQALQGVDGSPYWDTGRIPLSGVTTYQGTAAAQADALKNQYYFVTIVDGADTLDYNAGYEIGFTDV